MAVYDDFPPSYFSAVTDGGAEDITVVLGILGVLLGTAGYWGVLEGYWVLEVLEVLLGNRGY